MADDRHERIRRRAHAIWEREGRRDGDHERHWHQAAGEIDAEDAAAAKPGRKAATPRKPAAAKPNAAPSKATAAKAAKPAVAAKPRAGKAKAE